MIRIDVPDVDAWWADNEAKQLREKFPSLRMNPPKDFPRGCEVHFIDLTGVCWHVGNGS